MQFRSCKQVLGHGAITDAAKMNFVHRLPPSTKLKFDKLAIAIVGPLCQWIPRMYAEIFHVCVCTHVLCRLTDDGDGGQNPFFFPLCASLGTLNFAVTQLAASRAVVVSVCFLVRGPLSRSGLNTKQTTRHVYNSRLSNSNFLDDDTYHHSLLFAGLAAAAVGRRRGAFKHL